MIIDTHMHIGGDKLGFLMKEDMVIEALTKYQVSLGIVSNIDGAEFDHQQNPIPEILLTNQVDCLKRMITFARLYSQKIKIAVWIRPIHEQVTPEFEKLIADNLDIICALKLHPYHAKISPNDQKVVPYLEIAKKYHLAFVSHTGGCEEARSIHVYEAALCYPSINFVMVHLDLESTHQEAIDLLGKLPNLYGDTTWVDMNTTLSIIKKYGSKKLVFGSDAPIDGTDTYMHNKTGERSIYQDYFHILPTLISKEEYDDLMYQNACKVFHIKK